MTASSPRVLESPLFPPTKRRAAGAPQSPAELKSSRASWRRGAPAALSAYPRLS